MNLGVQCISGSRNLKETNNGTKKHQISETALAAVFLSIFCGLFVSMALY